MENQISTGLSQSTGGANGLITSANIIGAPATYATQANVFAVGCTLYQRDSSTGYTTVVWTNTGTVAVPVWTQQGISLLIAAGATKTLTQPQSGSTVLLDTAAGSVVTLPAPKVGLRYTFIISTTVTSNSHKVITDAGTTFLLGGLAMGEAAGTTTLNALGDGSANVAVTMNGTTTGGIKGSRFTVECISTTVWEVSGIINGSGTLATPFANS